MSVHQVYETAFDSTVKVPDVDYLDDLAQSPLICGTVLNFPQDSAVQSTSFGALPSRSASSTRLHSHATTPKTKACRVGSAQEIRSSCCRTYRGTPSSRDFSKRFPTQDSRNSARDTCRPHSDPLDRRKADSNLRSIAENNSKSNPVFHLPLEQSTSNTNASKTFSPSTEFKKLEVGEEKDSETLQSSKSICSLPERPPTLALFNETKKSSAFCREKLALGDIKATTEDSADAKTSRDDNKRNYSQMGPAVRPKMSLDFGQPSKRPRRNFLDFWTPGHNAFREVVDPSVELEKQGWYHGSINHKDAENALRLLKEGSFLVRCCKTSRQNYSLSIKSANGVMHMKISQCGNGRYNLKQQSESFDSIPEMVYHFSMHPLPVYGLEHVMLKSPVINQLL